MQLRSGNNGPLFVGEVPGDILIWTGSEWAVASATGSILPNVASARFDTAFHQITGDPTVSIGELTITLRANSQVRVDAMVPVQGSVANGRALVGVGDTGNVPLNDSKAEQSFGTTLDTQFRTMNLLTVLGPQPAGDLTVHLIIDVNGAGGARVDSNGVSFLVLTEIFG